MGWTSSPAWTSPSDIKREILADLAHSGHKVLDTASTKYGRNLWIALEEKSGRKLVLLVLIEGSRGGGDQGYAYKDIPETMGPAETGCPLRLLAMTDEPTEQYAVEWRKRVRALAATQKSKKADKYEVGDKTLVYGKLYTVVGTVGRSYHISPVDDPNKLYKCGPTKMNRPVQVTPEVA